jgi:hypothetical protein
MSLTSVWINTGGAGFENFLIDPENYRDATSHAEFSWRVMTGCSHIGWLAAHAGMLRRIAASLLLALQPPKYLALPAPPIVQPKELVDKPQRPLSSNYREALQYAAQMRARYRADSLQPKHDRNGISRCVCACATDHDYIEAMFALYSQGRARLI